VTQVKRTYTSDELHVSVDYATPHLVGDQRLHGGFLADGTYEPPRTRHRVPALDAWEASLRDRGGAPFDASSELLAGVRVPTTDQQRVLLRNGLGEVFWNGLTITGKIEARGRFLGQLPVPDLQAAIVEDISEMAIGHLDKGLLTTHGLDEGGQPELGIGGHDAMWFALRDLAFGAGAYPDVEPESSIGRDDAGKRLMPEVDEAIEGLFAFLANLLIIEFRAELGFAETQEILRTPDLFGDRRAEAEQAAEMVERIRTDELIHVRSLNLYLGELRSVTLRTVDGGTVPGAELIDRFWAGLVRWATVEQPSLVAERQRNNLAAVIERHPDAARVRAEFERAA
jgi:hypothetical protein